MGSYLRLIAYGSENEKREAFLKGTNTYVYTMDQFHCIEGSPYVYWAGEALRDSFKNDRQLAEFGDAKIGLQTGDTQKFIRLWFEIDSCSFNVASCKWFPINKGGEYRKWFGNNLNVVDWQDNGKNIKTDKLERLKAGLIEKKNSKCWNEDYYFRRGITWNLISSSSFSARCYENMIFDIASNGYFVFDDSNYLYIAGLLNSKVTQYIADALNPTMNLSAGVLSKLPVKDLVNQKSEINEEVQRCIDLAKTDWNMFEVSYEFCTHPLVGRRNDKMSILLSDKYLEWEAKCNQRFQELKSNEEKINEIFITAYGLENELDSTIKDEDVSVRLANQEREIKSLISYAVGCIMGRYSIKEEGLIYAGGNWDDTRYAGDFKPCEFGVLPITEEQFFEVDLCTRVIDFVKVVYGEDSLVENLKFIAATLKPDSYEAPKKIIRDYLFNDFFTDHYQIYQRRPIYWQLDSGKAGGFRAIAYMHRFTENTLPLVRTEFIQDLRYKYEEEMQRQKSRLEGASSTAESNAIKKDIAALDKKIVECAAYDELLNHATSSIQNYLFDLDDGVKNNYAKFLSIDGDKNSNILTVVKL